MSESLRDQLLKTDLGKLAKKQSGSQKKSKTRRKTESGSDLKRAWAARKKAETNEQLQKRQQKQAEQKRRQELNKQISGLIDSEKLNSADAPLARNFLHHGKIRKIMVEETQLKQLNNGELAVVFLRGRYFLVSQELARKVAQLSPYHVPDLAGAEDAAEEEHPVPDDLIW